MKPTRLFFLILLLLTALTPQAQNTTSGDLFTLRRCIDYALEHNIAVKQSDLAADVDQVAVARQKMSRFPTVEASARQNFSWSQAQSLSTGGWSYEGAAVTSAGVNASVNLYNGLQTRLGIRQGEADYQAGRLAAETQRESVALQVLGAYTRVLYADAQVENAMHQLELTTSQTNLAKERLAIGAIAHADYLQVEAQQAAEALTLTNARNQLASDRITLMQLMEYPVTDSFGIVIPDLSQVMPPLKMPEAGEVYQQAVSMKPQVKQAALKVLSAAMATDIAKGAALPALTMDAGLATNYTDKVQQLSFGSQLEHNLSPTLGLTLSVPVFRQGQIKAQVATATIRSEISKLDEKATLNTLRKNIENACLDVAASAAEFVSAQHQHQAAQASYDQALERFARGVINAVDFLIQKTSLNAAANALLQARYNLIYSYKTLDFYAGNSITY